MLSCPSYKNNNLSFKETTQAEDKKGQLIPELANAQTSIISPPKDRNGE